MSNKRPWHKRLKYRLIYILVWTIILKSMILPRKLLIVGCGLLGKLAYYLFGKERKNAVNNLNLAFGKEKTADQIQKLVKRNFMMIGRNAGDLLNTISIRDIEKFEKYVEVKGKENLPPVNDGRGTIFLTAHLGSFDLVGSFLGLSGYKLHIIGKPLKDEKLNKMLADYRNTRGGVFVPRGQDTVKLFRALKEGGSVAILIDLDTKVKSVFVDFFGHPASTPVGAALFALRTNARVVPIFIHMDDKMKQVLEILPEIQITHTGNEEQDIIENTQRMSNTYESIIRQHPDQWIWIHERWKTQPSGEPTLVTN